MTDRLNLWGAGPSARYDELIAPYRPVLQNIAAGAVNREREHVLPRDEIAALKALGLPALRLPRELSGSGATLPELFALLIELSAADPNLTNAFRSHFGVVEDLLISRDQAWRDIWFSRIRDGQTFGSALSETGGAALGRFGTTATRDGEHWRINGRKFYTTGSLYAEWLNLGVSLPDGSQARLVVPTDAEGVQIIDDWDGFGQQLSASGTIILTEVLASDEQFQPTSTRFLYSNGFFQTVHLATLAGIGRSAANEVATLLRNRKRVYGRGNASVASQDAQLLAVIGEVRAAAYAAASITLTAAAALERAHQGILRDTDASDLAQLRREAEFEVNQAVTVVTDLILKATTTLFDALGASALLREHGLDRHWRNARTLCSHNPRIYHARIVGDWAVNGTEPVAHGGVGIASA
ncbi:monooxygenase [Devosia epidermidihirudinis]|uniref:Monooxygenase n=1 Tax=Devosia epidermidihirudinis TaxID=1293439 RepID=A0A0F5QAF7_9HYPH|nr:acyl-CoA dehydrogenase family protein [Devosia epidermidihirudinis]KKC37982.1 monooxygenase [Devosia epidermidihirudinis]